MQVMLLFLLWTIHFFNVAANLEAARKLVAPVPLNTAGAEFERADFWDEHSELLASAWKEYGLNHSTLGEFSNDFIASDMRAAINEVKKNPNEETEAAVRALFVERVPGVYAAKLFSNDFIMHLREELKCRKSAGIPTRRPNGMNRYGLILSDVGLNEMVRGLAMELARPLVELLFPTRVRHEDMSDFFGFTIQYSADEDLALAEHRDASVATMNINLNPVNHDGSLGFTASELYFVDEDTASVHHVLQFEPGMAIIHKGEHRHAASPITAGQRTNMILWLFGEGGYVRHAPYAQHLQHTPQERWSAHGATTATDKKWEL